MDHNFQEYENTQRYDEENVGAWELPAILKWCDPAKGTILDAATGTGRIAIPLAKEGYEVVGVDIHEGMLERAKEKSAALNLPITWELADCEQLPWQDRFQFITMGGNSFQHFLTNEKQEGLLRSFNQALKPGGICMFDLRFPTTDELYPPDELIVDHRYTCEDGRICEVAYHSSYNPLTQIVRYKTVRTYELDGNREGEDTTYIDLRYTYPQELIRLIYVSGFDLVHMWGGWKEQPLTADSVNIVVVARKR